MGGLCNRLRAMLSALALSHDYDGTIRVEWHPTAECRARFEDLFVPIGSGRFVIENGHWWTIPSRKSNLHIPRILRTLMGYTSQHDDYRPTSLGDVSEMLRHHKKVYLSSGMQLADYPHECLHRLQPRYELKQRIEQLKRQFAETTIGVHIRRTDNARSIEESPVSAFVAAMKKELQRNAKVKFFVATDDAAVKEELKRLFSAHIITQQSAVRRDTVEGMRDALVDLWCLASTQHILGSYWSSFTDTAAEIGHVPLTVVRNVQDSK